MSITVGDIAQIQALQLTVLAGSDELHRTVRWVHVAEVADPTPWLRGSEFLLTTGLMLNSVDPLVYVERLNRSGVSALGFGIGVVYQEVPADLVAAAESVGLPIVRVPLETPYVAISETVSNLLTEQKVNDAQRIANSQKSLVNAALTGETRTMLSTAAALIDGWVVTTDRHGRYAASTPAHIAERIELLRSDLERMSSGQIPVGSVIVHGETILIQPILQNDLVWAFVIAGAKTMREFERYVVSSAVSLLTLEASLEYRFRVDEHRRRRLALRSLLTETPSAEWSEEQLEEWGFTGRAVRVAVLTGSDPRLREILQRIIGHLSSNQITTTAAGLIEPRFLAMMVEADGFEAMKDLLTKEIAAHPQVSLATGSDVELGYAALSYRSLKRVAMDGLRENRRVSHTGTALSLDFVLSRTTDTDTLIAYCRSRLGSLFRLRPDATHEVTLKTTLKTFLEADGRWREASEQLGIHRHTLRRRIEQIERALGIDLGSSSTRMELWFALLAEEIVDASGSAWHSAQRPGGDS